MTGVWKDYTFNLHHDVLLKNSTTFGEYWSDIKDILNTRYEEGYPIVAIPIVEIMLWNMDLLANKKLN